MEKQEFFKMNSALILKNDRATLSTDELHKNLLCKFREDMAEADGEDFLQENGECYDTADIRRLAHDMRNHSSIYRFKARYQYCTYFKRYVCRDETLSNNEREAKSLAGFVSTQERVASQRQDALPLYSKILVQDARKIIKEVLGKYNPSQHSFMCRFGKRASMGVLYKDSYLDNKIQTLTSSVQHWNWFKREVLTADLPLFTSIMEAGGLKEANLKCLELSTVPKAWDKLRTILKNTTVGAFYTAGLGDYMVEMMRQFGINLNRRAFLHAKWIKRHSITRKYVTTDLSAASDSYWRALMNMLFPRDWYVAMKTGQIPYVRVGEKDESFTQMSSFMTMGMGFTFPAQSLAFYAIVKAVMNRMSVEGLCSSYGDDLIYPRECHKTVVHVFETLGFIINTDKSYADEYFRESCGADYYAGADVRPYQPEGVHTLQTGTIAVSSLYKILNGWTRRWDPVEIPRVYNYLLDTISAISPGPILQVPVDFPDYSGYKTPYPLDDERFAQPVMNCHGSVTIATLGMQRKLRHVPIQMIYLWDHLRSKEVEYVPCIWDKMEDSTVLIWRPKIDLRRRKKPPSRRPRRPKAYVTEKGGSFLFVENSKTLPVWQPVGTPPKEILV